MGLTIHYELGGDGIAGVRDARRIVAALRDAALDLPFEEVGPVLEFADSACDWQAAGEEHRWLLIQARRSVILDAHGSPVEGYDRDWSSSIAVQARRIVAFEAWPGEGCEESNFGLCLFPGTTKTGRDRTVRTGFAGWSWHSFCKTQYASAEEAGGVPNFLRCHTTVIRLLDRAKAMGVLTDVHDEGHYWEGRDLRALAQEVGEWNTMIAGMAAQLKATFGEARVVAAIDGDRLETP